MQGEQRYEVRSDMSVMFTNQTAEPIFKTNTWAFEMIENNASIVKDLPFNATYDDADDKDQPKYYYLAKEDEAMNTWFHEDETTGQLSLKQGLNYEMYQQMNFRIVASNSKNKMFSYNDNSYLNVSITVSTDIFLKE